MAILKTLDDVKTSYEKIKEGGFKGDELLEWVKKTYAPFVGDIIYRLDWDKKDINNKEYLNMNSPQITREALTKNYRDAFINLVGDKTSTIMMTSRGSDNYNAKTMIRQITGVYNLLSKSADKSLSTEIKFSNELLEETNNLV